MTPETLRRVAGDLDAVGCAWALAGGLAVSVWTDPRFTSDIDIAVAVADDRAAVRSLVELVVTRGAHRGRDLVAMWGAWSAAGTAEIVELHGDR